MAFLSLLDDRVRNKGSRDPLGFESVWTSFGRQVVGNLTTVTGSWVNFAVALLGFHWCNELCSGVPTNERLEALQAHFMRFEQLAAYLRCLEGKPQGEILGVTRVQQGVQDESGQVTLGNQRRCQILSNQITSGLWGLYSSAMRESGLVEGELRQPTAAGHEIAETIERHLNKANYIDLIKPTENKIEINELNALKAEFLAGLRAPAVKRLLIDELLSGSPTQHLQSELQSATNQLAQSASNLLAQYAKDHTPKRYIDELRQLDLSPELDAALNNIECVERLLVSADVLFNYCRRKDGSNLDDLAREIDQHLRFDFIPGTPSLEKCPYPDILDRIRYELRSGKSRSALQSIHELNSRVMANRGGAPWVETQGKTLRVRIKSETGELPEQSYLETEWRFTYFLTSFVRIAASRQA